MIKNFSWWAIGVFVFSFSKIEELPKEEFKKLLSYVPRKKKITLDEVYNRLKDKDYVILKGENKGKLIAVYVAYAIEDSLYLWVGAVDPTYRGRSITKMALDLFETLAIGRYSKLTIKVPKNSRLEKHMEKRGFRKVGELGDAVIMKKTLGLQS